ncbi:MAG: serine hydrolase [Streptosporangiales bacterium]|nr:serine hydrolase [Streptosporangiales bacterium]
MDTSEMTRSSETSESGRGRPGWRVIAGLSGVFLVAAVVAALVAPWPVSLPAEGGGPLAERVRAAAGTDGRLGLSVALAERGGASANVALGEPGGGAGGPVRADTPFEIGSVNKALTGMLLAEMEERGEVTAATTLGEIYRGRTFSDPEVASVTLGELASHRAGMPRVGGGPVAGILEGITSNWAGGDPYGSSPEELLDRASVGDRGTYAYSNLGVSLLGHALAERAGRPYPELLRERILAPLGMDATYIAGERGAPPPGYARPHRESGAQVEPWGDDGFAPAGSSTWSTAGDMAKLLRAVRDGSAPGAAAAKPRWATDTENERIGYAWHVTSYDGVPVTWHNGGTGGSRAFVGFTPGASGSAVAVLSNTDRGVDSAALRLLGVRDVPGGGSPDVRTFVLIAVTVLFSLMAVAGVAGVAGIRAADGVGVSSVAGVAWLRRRRARSRRPAPDRAEVLAQVVGGVLLLAVTWRGGLWEYVPVLFWIAGVGAFTVLAAIALLSWRRLPWVRPGVAAWRRWASPVGTFAVLIGYLAILVPVLAGLG